LKVTDILKQSVPKNFAAAEAPLPASLATLRWAFINEWKVEPQSDDRAPVFGEIGASSASASAQRSTARRKHQAMFKEWSQDRHD
jgi:hypothetical protein